MNIISYFNRPEYLLRPSQVVRKFRRIFNAPKDIEEVSLPWGARVKVHLCENVGAAIFYYGVFDKIIPEAIWRLLDPSEIGCDVGANIGQNTSAMVARVGEHGKVIAFEPHPQVFSELTYNSSLWNGKSSQSLELNNVALSDSAGSAVLKESIEFSYNRGSATLKGQNSGPGKEFEVALKTLDEYVHRLGRIDVCKIDVEGHEMSVLKGAAESLGSRRIRDIVFEDFNPQPSEMTVFLKGFGFEIFELREQWSGPRLLAPRAGKQQREIEFSFNYLATLEPQRALNRFKGWGWRCLTC